MMQEKKTVTVTILVIHQYTCAAFRIVADTKGPCDISLPPPTRMRPLITASHSTRYWGSFMSRSIRCGHCQTDFVLPPQQTAQAYPCPQCGRTAGPSALDDAIVEVEEVFEAESIDVTAGVDEFNFDNLPDPIQPAPIQPTPQTSRSPAPRPVTGATSQPPAAAKKSAAVAAISIAGLLSLVCVGALIWYVASRPNPAPVAGSSGPLASENSADRENSDGRDAESGPQGNPPSQEPNSVAGVDHSGGSDRPTVTQQTRQDTGVHRSAAAVASSRVDQRTPAEILASVKAATVYIEVRTSEGEQSGSGFLLEGDGRKREVVTNAHVITPEQGSVYTITCVLHSGRKNEVRLPASVVAKDDQNDLAILSINHNDIPRGVPFLDESKVHETLPVLTVGFPLGDVLKTSQRGPQITITKGSISSIRRDDHDSVVFYQIDGGINPGNSGGPVMTESGQLVGIAVAKVNQTEIGFAIPARVLQNSLRGQVANVQVYEQDRDRSGEGLYQFRVEVTDPHENIESAKVLVFLKSNQALFESETSGLWKQAAAEAFVLFRGDLHKEEDALIHEDVRLKGLASKLMFQIAWQLNDGTLLHTAPTSMLGSTSSTTRLDIGARADQAPSEGDNAHVTPLPRLIRDFAFREDNGDLVGLGALDHRVYLMSAADVDAGDLESVPSIDVGHAPVAVAFKQFADSAYYLVVCDKGTDIHLIDANEFTIEKKIHAQTQGFSDISASLNPQDPFVYYCNSEGVGAIDLRTMSDIGPVIRRAATQHCEVSADGQVIYRLGNKRPTGLDAFHLVNGLTAKQPVFVGGHHGNSSPPAYIVDPAGFYVAAGASVFEPDLKRRLKDLDCVPLCFLRDRPIVVCSDGRSGSDEDALQFRFKSTNTFEDVARRMSFPNRMLIELTGEQIKYLATGGVRLASRLYADENNDRLLVAVNDRIIRIPIAEIGLPDERFLRLPANRSAVHVGRQQTIPLQPTDPAVQWSIGQTPDGVERVDGGLRWKPSDADVGATYVPITLSADGVERELMYRIDVGQPSVRCPLDIRGFDLDPQGRFALCWSGPMIQSGGAVLNATRGAGNDNSSLSLVPLRKGIQPNTVTLPFAIRRTLRFGSYLALQSTREHTKVHVYNIKNLSKAETLTSASALVDIRVEGNKLILQGNRSKDIYNATSLSRVESTRTPTTRNTTRPQPNGLLRDGILKAGVLRNAASDQPMLIVHPGPFVALMDYEQTLVYGSFLRSVIPPTNVPRYSAPRDDSVQGFGPIVLPKRGWQVCLLMKSENELDPRFGQVVYTRTLTLVVIDQEGKDVTRVPIAVDQAVGRQNDNTLVPQIAANGDSVFVTFGDRIYRWTAKDQVAQQNSDQPQPMYVVPQQSTLAVTASDATLTHEVQGGVPPYKFRLMSHSDAVTIDESTGQVNVNYRALIKAAVTKMDPARIVRPRSSEPELRNQLEAKMSTYAEPFEQRTWRGFRQFPFALPIHIKAVDQAGSDAALQYFLLVEFPTTELARLFKQSQSE